MVIIPTFKIRFRYVSESNMTHFWGELICNHDVPGIERKPSQKYKKTQHSFKLGKMEHNYFTCHYFNEHVVSKAN